MALPMNGESHIGELSLYGGCSPHQDTRRLCLELPGWPRSDPQDFPRREAALGCVGWGTPDKEDDRPQEEGPGCPTPAAGTCHGPAPE